MFPELLVAVDFYSFVAEEEIKMLTSFIYVKTCHDISTKFPTFYDFPYYFLHFL